MGLELAEARRRVAQLEAAVALCPCGGFCENGTIPKVVHTGEIERKSLRTHCPRCGAELPVRRSGDVCVLCEQEMTT